jgi:hypothetical protein
MVTAPLAKLDGAGFHYTGSASHTRSLRTQFREQHFLCLPKILSPPLTSAILRRAGSADFSRQIVESGVELAPGETRLHLDISTVFWQPHFLRLIERITGKGSFDTIAARLYRMDPGTDHHFDWHSDCTGTRLVGLSLNLSPEPYVGGIFQIRSEQRPREIFEFANRGLGDLLLFDIDPAKNHRVTPVTGKLPKLAYAGWLESRTPGLS